MNSLLRMVQPGAMPPPKYAATLLGSTTRQGITYPGGLDQLTPSQMLHPGAITAGLNFECVFSGGYARCDGYERTDGRTAPSSAVFTLVQVASFTNVPSVGTAVTQATSGATGTVAALKSDMSPYYLILTKTSGTWDDSHAITSAGPVAIGTATTTTVTLTAQETAQYNNAAADIYRADIEEVPGSGSVLGVLAMAFSGTDNLYAWRANSGGTAVDIYKTSGSGWVNVPFYKIVEFTAGGTAIPAEGQTLTQGGVTATIKRIMQRSGSADWNGNAAGAFVITTPSGGSFAAGAATVSTSSATVTLSGAQTTISLLPGGHFEFGKGNFGGQLTTRRAYGADGINKCFEFDGDILAPITTGLTDDTPDHIAFHYNMLFVSKDASCLHSAPGFPFRWSSVDQGGEVAVGDTVTCMISMPGNQNAPALAIYQQSNTSILYGSNPDPQVDDFRLVNFITDAGARPYSAQTLFDTFTFDHLGVVGLSTTLNFGNFSANSYTRNMMPFIIQERTSVIASAVNHTKGQYRVFFSTGYALYLTFAGQQFVGAIPQFFPNPVTCTDISTTQAGEEVGYFGSTDGFVYQFDKGTSFDGDNIDAFITLAWDNFRSPRQLKAYRGARVEISAPGYVGLQFGYQLGYGTTSITQPTAADYSANFVPPPVWDEFTWDEFTWDGTSLDPTSVDMSGSGENVQVTLTSSTDYIASYTLTAINYRYSMRRGLREG